MCLEQRGGKSQVKGSQCVIYFRFCYRLLNRAFISHAPSRVSWRFLRPTGSPLELQSMAVACLLNEILVDPYVAKPPEVCGQEGCRRLHSMINLSMNQS